MTTPIRATLAGVHLGDGLPVAVMGALNVSPGSFYAGSVVTSSDDLLRAAERMAREGAALLDVGALSTAPYLAGTPSPPRKRRSASLGGRDSRAKLGVAVSADTSRAEPARAALEAGACIINDVRGLTADPALASLVAERGAGVIVMASEPATPTAGAGETVLPSRRCRPSRRAGDPPPSSRIAAQAGIAAERVVVDPGIGFFRRRDIPGTLGLRVLAGLGRFRALGRPICVGVSRKSFIGEIAGEPDPARRLPGSLAAATAAVLAGAHMIRAHDVADTVQAVRVAEAMRGARSGS